MAAPSLRYDLELAVARSAPRLSRAQHEMLSRSSRPVRRCWAARGDIPTHLAERGLARDEDLEVRSSLAGLSAVSRDMARARVAADGHRAAAVVAFRDDIDDVEAASLLTRIPERHKEAAGVGLALRHRRGGPLHGSERRIAVVLSEGYSWQHICYTAAIADNGGRVVVERRLRDGLAGVWRTFEHGAASRMEAFDLAYHQSPEWLKERFAPTHEVVPRARCFGEFYEPVEEHPSPHPWWGTGSASLSASLGRLWPVYGSAEAGLVCALAGRNAPFVRAVQAVVRLTRSTALAALLDTETSVHESLVNFEARQEPF